MSKVLIFGGTGMLGHRMALTLAGNHQVAITSRREETDGLFSNEAWEGIKVYNNISVENFNHVERVICKFRPEIIINCVGIIKQLHESNDPTLALSINSLFPQKLAKLQERLGYRLILLSTDCVFNGEKGDYTEQDIPNATDLYGMSKLLGEVHGQESVLTIRTSIIGRELCGNSSLIEWFLSQKQLDGYTNMIFSGLPTFTLSKLIRDTIIPNESLQGLFHISSNSISKYELLQKINMHYNLNKEISPNSEMILNRSLNSEKFISETNFNCPNWDDLIKDLAINNLLYS